MKKKIEERKVVCPHCKKKFPDGYGLLTGSFETLIAFLDEDGELDMDSGRGEYDIGDLEIGYQCPFCRKLVAKTDREAKKFLQGVKEPK